MRGFVSALLLMAALICLRFASIYCMREDIPAKQAFVQCSEAHQVSEEVINSIRNHAFIPDDQELKCWLGCVFKKLGMMKEGKIDWASSVHFTKLCRIGEQDRNKTEKVIKICQAEVPQDEKDECQLAYSATVCKIKAWNELDLSKGKSDN